MPEGEMPGIFPLFSTRYVAVHPNQQVPRSSWFQLESPTGDLVGYQIQKESDVGRVFILLSLNLQSHLYVPSSLQGGSLLFFKVADTMQTHSL